MVFLKMRNLTTNIKAVEQVVAGLFVIEEHLEVLKHALVNGHRVKVADGIFSQEVELNDVLFAILLLVQLHVFEAQRAATNSVSNLVSVLLVTSSQRQLQATNCVPSSHKNTQGASGKVTRTLSMKYIATARCRMRISLLFMSSR